VNGLGQPAASNCDVPWSEFLRRNPEAVRVDFHSFIDAL
jgi:hypothetical protein